MFSEKDMEDRIAAEPERFLGEQGLSLVGRQVPVGPYIFDLMFEDRHGAKLIVELQKGTLDRSHTYKILDYYDEYRERNPGEFIDLLVAANRVPAERKKRLAAMGVAYRELPEGLFMSRSEPPDAALSEVAVSPAMSDEVNLQSAAAQSARCARFRTLGDSATIRAVRALFERCAGQKLWNFSGKASLIGVLLPATRAIDEQRGKGLKAQFWVERPDRGMLRCKFEVAYRIRELSPDRSRLIRERVATSMRGYLVEAGLLHGVRLSGRSTVLTMPIEVSPIRRVEDDTDENVARCRGQLDALCGLLPYLENHLGRWARTVDLRSG